MIKTLIPLLIIGTAVAGLAWSVIPSASKLLLKRGDIHFPTVSGFNLNRQEFEFPRDFAGEFNILFVPFLQEQQRIVDSWVPFTQETEAAFPNVIYYELPTIDKMPALARMFINEGMRAGIADQTARQRTITLYIDTEKFRQATDIPGRDQVHILLVNRDGDILWRTTGSFTEDKGQDLLEAVQFENFINQ